MMCTIYTQHPRYLPSRNAGRGGAVVCARFSGRERDLGGGGTTRSAGKRGGGGRCGGKYDAFFFLLLFCGAEEQRIRARPSARTKRPQDSDRVFLLRGGSTTQALSRGRAKGMGFTRQQKFGYQLLYFVNKLT